MDILNENINSTSDDKGFAEETSLDEQENEDSQEVETAIVTTADFDTQRRTKNCFRDDDEVS